MAQVPTSTACGREAKPQASEVARRAIRSYLSEIGRDGTVEPGPTSVDFSRVRFALMGRPKVSIIIASACKPVFLHGETTYYARRCIDSIQAKSTYDNVEIILISNNDIPPDLDAWLKPRHVKVIVNKVPFNWSGVQNLGASKAQGDYFLFLNDDMEVVTPDWLEAMLEFAQFPRSAPSAPRLYYRTAVCNMPGSAARRQSDARSINIGYHPVASSTTSCTATSPPSGGCLTDPQRRLSREVGGFDVTFPLEFNDVDYCLKVVSSGRTDRLYALCGTHPLRVCDT